jgi:lipopolysaccharide export system permease protein
MRTEFHKRLVNIVALFVLPILAVPFAVGSRRTRRAYSFGLAVVILIGFHEVIEQGSVAAQSGAVSPLLALWLPCGLLTAFAVWRFYNACFRIKADRLQDFAERIGDGVQRIISRFRRDGQGAVP